MVFSVLDKQTIQCVMSEKEIADYGMDKRTIYQNDARTADFFREIMNRAQQETGFTKKGAASQSTRHFWQMNRWRLRSA